MVSMFLDPNELNKLSRDAVCELNSMVEGVEKWQFAIKYARFCYNNNMDNDAFYYFRYILEQTTTSNTIKKQYRELA